MATSLTPKDTNDGQLSESLHEMTKLPPCRGQSVTNDWQQPNRETSKTIDRTNDSVYIATTKVVKAIMSLSQGVEKSAAAEYLDLVRHVGIELRALLSSVDTLASIFPSHALKYDSNESINTLFSI